ncbi:hypothetical protein C8A01DRAFT_13962 [Parachaetomium inaequale]|uniref:R3H domain-containing protein n=1 Tax=Parachaetomium inaequale TaxID=2588326 RepID=A0AAN6PPV1_9PEZI|nr:hypothetical protein C8A01DRAFT_13962 [Parachaetomium inaequale]
MTEAPAVSSQRGSHRGRGGRRGRFRRGHSHGPRQSNSSGDGGQPAQPEPAVGDAEPVAAASEAGDVTSQRGNQPGRGRGGRDRRGGRGRGTGQRSIVVSHRGGRGPPAIPGRGGSNLPGFGFSAAAAEFVPGQPVPTSRFRQQTAPRVMSKSTAADLPTRIHEDIDHRQYECVMCTNEVLRNSKVWSCSVCWTVTHLSCVKKWHTNQMKQREENPGPNQPEGWRCPGCNSTLVEQPGPYRCWCGKDVDPKPIAGLPPHTCGQTCSKSKATCPHQCSLMCHAGPCPPCTLMGPTQSCFCGKNTSTKRCSETDYGKGWSCQEPCGDLLPCGEHYCTQTCHGGLCGACEIPMPSTCYCGKEQREIACNQRNNVLESFNHGQMESPPASDSTESDSDKWFEASFRCSKICGRQFDCGHHTCQKPCHPQDEEAAHCPFSPDVVTNCPCGKTPLDSMAVEPRRSCQDPVPHCDKPCNKVLACGHLCLDECHTGPCAPCTQYADISCRCGRTTTNSACHQGNIARPHCFRVCRAQLNCGRHECGERCCSGEKAAAERRKQKRSANENYEPEHICLQVCGRLLKCGQHTCQQLCHKGPCMACPEAIFDEISCACGRTVLQPPQPCGTRPPECRFLCTRARPCGHPSVEHQCHPDDAPCPKCPFLMEKPCVCGKKTLKNQPCWFEEGRCGLPCGKKLKCGVHECRKSCHKPGECEDAGISGSHCSQLCGKVRKSCEHTCADQCHAPYPCKEDKPCQSKTFITCPCQHRKQEVRCQATKLNPSTTRESTLKCDDECLRLQRNRKLAEALDIDPSTHTDDHIPYSDTTLKRFRGNVNWAQEQERELRVFAAAQEEKRIRFKPMQSHQRAFLHALAEDFGLDSESQDPEPHRHVCIFKTPRFVSAPQKTLAQCLRIANTAAQLGAGASALKPAAPAPSQQQQPPFNALVLKDPRFGLTIDELDAALATELASASRSGPALTFTTSFLPSEEILIKATPNMTAAAIATSLLAPTAQAVETTLSNLKTAVARIVARQGLAGAVALCHVDASSSSSSSSSSSESIIITRREGDAAANNGGWSAVASRGSWRRAAAANRASTAAGGVGVVVSEQRAPSAFVALRRLEVRKKTVVVEEKVEEDWLAAVEREEEMGEGKEGEEGEEGEEKEKEEGWGGSDDASGKEGVVSGEVDGVAGKEEEEAQGETEQGGSKQEETKEETIEETKEETKQEETKAHTASVAPEGAVDV